MDELARAKQAFSFGPLLEEAFAEGIESGHPDMPVFEADIIQLQDIISYIASIQTID